MKGINKRLNELNMCMNCPSKIELTTKLRKNTVVYLPVDNVIRIKKSWAIRNRECIHIKLKEIYQRIEEQKQNYKEISYFKI